jgi:SAM-dependent methyltransferase
VNAKDVRRALIARTMSHAEFARRLDVVPFRDRDVWVDEVLGLAGVEGAELDALPADVGALPRGAVPYLPCGVDAILHAVRDAPVTRNDVFVDLGAGLGRVAMLVHLLTGARAIGVELQQPLVARAREAAAALGMRTHDVDVRLGDAAVTPVPEGDVFFSYASFSPGVLRAVLRHLEANAATKRIVLCAVGFDVHDAPWLRARASNSAEVSLYESR